MSWSIHCRQIPACYNIAVEVTVCTDGNEQWMVEIPVIVIVLGIVIVIVILIIMVIVIPVSVNKTLLGRMIYIGICIGKQVPWNLVHPVRNARFASFRTQPLDNLWTSLRIRLSTYNIYYSGQSNPWRILGFLLCGPGVAPLGVRSLESGTFGTGGGSSN